MDQQVVEARVQQDGSHEPRQEYARDRVGALVGQRHRHDGEDAGGAPVHDRRAEAAHHVQCQGCLGATGKVEEILDHAEAGADRKAEDCAVDQHAHAPGPHQVDDHQRLERLFDRRRDVARIGDEAQPAGVEQQAVQPVAHAGDQRADQHRVRHCRQAHQPVAVEQHQPGEEREHR
jgi:hypothetical protein